MILKWIQGLLGTRLRGTGAPEAEFYPRSRLVDVAYEALRKEALSKTRELKGLEQGAALIRRKENLRTRVRTKIKKALFTSFVKEDEDFELVDEVTEKIVDAAEADPKWQKLFDNNGG